MSDYAILDSIQSPEKLKMLSKYQLKDLSDEIRSFIIENISNCGGHLASNLGIVELTIALHVCFDTAVDRIVWDVGHQSYAHKLLTGRKDAFHTIRQSGGISGFPKSSESIHDAFDTGHSSTAISAAFGMACARDLRGDKNHVLAVVGDGSMTGGLSFEALNNAGRSKRNMIVILNDNEMSISKNVGALSTHLNDIRTAPAYIDAKRDVNQFLKHMPLGKNIGKTMEAAKEKVKYLLIPGILFEEIGFRYFGPVDGHDIDGLINVLGKLKSIKGPILLHVYTKKGKGYEFAEQDPGRYHGVAAFDINTGARLTPVKKTYADVFGNTLYKMAAKNKQIVAITAAMSEGTGLVAFEKRYPKRFFDVGIAEGHGAVFAAGLAKSGIYPVFAVYSSFLQRAYDQVLHDIAIQNLPMLLAVDHAGVVPGDGQTHQGLYDIAFLRHIPNLVIMAPKDTSELTAMMHLSLQVQAPVAIRYPKATANKAGQLDQAIELGRSEILRQGRGIAVIGIGPMVATAKKVVEGLCRNGHNPYLVNLRFIKPLDAKMLTMLYQNCSHIVTIEDHVTSGGAGSAVLEYYAANAMLLHITNYGYPDEFIEQGTREEIEKRYGMDAETILNDILHKLSLDAVKRNTLQ